MPEKPSVLWNFNNDTNQSMSEWVSEWVSESGICKAPLASWANGAKNHYCKQLLYLKVMLTCLNDVSDR